MSFLDEQIRNLANPGRVYYDIFNFSADIDCKIATVNGLRLGLLAWNDPEWTGAQLGFVCWLLFVVGRDFYDVSPTFSAR